jgi:hypothetical protein
MFRCVFPRLLLAAGLLCAASVHAQSFGEFTRKFPATALRGEVVFADNTQITLNGTTAQLAPGARVFDADNRLLLLGDVGGRKAVVHYTTDLYGQPLTIWVLTPTERAKRPWPTTLAQAQSWRFDFDTQTWTQQ